MSRCDCDDHARSQNREKLSLPKHRDVCAELRIRVRPLCQNIQRQDHGTTIHHHGSVTAEERDTRTIMCCARACYGFMCVDDLGGLRVSVMSSSPDLAASRRTGQRTA
eukprot:scaffold1045_cov96-Phaeocystis_antarctica.AAC.1